MLQRSAGLIVSEESCAACTQPAPYPRLSCTLAAPLLEPPPRRSRDAALDEPRGPPAPSHRPPRVPALRILSHGLGSLYSEEAVERGVTHEAADFLATTYPYRLQEERWRQSTERMRRTDAALHAALGRAGYALDFGADGTGVFGKRFRQVASPPALARARPRRARVAPASR